MFIKEYLTEENSQIDFSKVRLNNLEALFKAVDFTFNWLGGFLADNSIVACLNAW